MKGVSGLAAAENYNPTNKSADGLFGATYEPSPERLEFINRGFLC